MNENGFTLIELLVALVVASLLVMGVAQIVALVADRYSVAAVDLDGHSDERLMIARSIANILPSREEGEIECTKTSLRAPINLPLSQFAAGVGRLAMSGKVGGGVRVEIASNGGRIVELTSEGWRNVRFACETRSVGPYSILDRVQVHWIDQNGEQKMLAAPRVSGVDNCEFDSVSRQCR